MGPSQAGALVQETETPRYRYSRAHSVSVCVCVVFLCVCVYVCGSWGGCRCSKSEPIFTSSSMARLGTSNESPHHRSRKGEVASEAEP